MIDSLSWITIYPELILLVMACVIAMVDLGVKTPLRGTTYALTLLTLAVVAVLEGVYASQGATVEEALAILEEATTLYLEESPLASGSPED